MYDARCARPPTGMGRLDYWGGVERYIYNRSGPAYQIVPTSADGDASEETCFISGENYEPVSLFPDLTYFPTEPDSTDCELNGVACASYTLRSPTYNETTGFDGNYTLTVDAKDGTPLRFHFTGFNVILGSHCTFDLLHPPCVGPVRLTLPCASMIHPHVVSCPRGCSHDQTTSTSLIILPSTPRPQPRRPSCLPRAP